MKTLFTLIIAIVNIILISGYSAYRDIGILVTPAVWALGLINMLLFDGLALYLLFKKASLSNFTTRILYGVELLLCLTLFYVWNIPAASFAEQF